MFSSLVICFFARGVYTPEVIQQALGAIGVTYSADDLKQLGTDILQQKHQFKEREGFDLKNIRIPKRILETPSPLGKIDESYMRQALSFFEEQNEIEQ